MTVVDVDSIEALRNALEVQPPATFDWLNLLIYGEAGAGKTYEIGTAEDDPRTSPVLILDVEGGLTTLRRRTGIDTVQIRGVEKVSNPEKNKKTIEYVFDRLIESIRPDGSLYYKTVGIDSLTELASLDMREIMKKAYARNPEKVEIDVPSPREWGISREHIRKIVRGFRDLPCNVIFTASLGISQEEGQPTKYYPGFAGKLANDVPGFMDVVGYLSTATQAEQVVRQLQVANTKRIRAKDRTAALGDLIINPTIPMMWNLIKDIPIPSTKEIIENESDAA